ncbi:MAG: serine protease [candidate division Zixibacteria bacterium]
MRKKQSLFKIIFIMTGLAALLYCFPAAPCMGEKKADDYGLWMKKPQSEWPQITMINQIEYTDNNHPIAGCGFLLDTGNEILAATAKHILVYFKSESMKSVAFNNTLKLWKMFPKNNPDDVVIVDKLINENPKEPLEHIPPAKDWLLFTIKKKSQNIQALKFRTGSMQEGETVYIIGWRYTDKDCPQVVYEGNFVRSEDGSFLITTKELSDNTMPGLSGSPVIDSNGYLIGLMSQKANKMERPSSIDYPKEILEERKKTKE